MKLKLKNIFSLLITLSLLSLSLIGVTHLLRPVDLDIAVDAVEVFHELPKDSIDVLCLGSSHMWRGLDPLTLYHEHGFSVYNYGCVAQKINTTLLFLQDAFRMQSPRVIIIDAFYANRLNDNKTFNSELYSTKHISFSKNKLAYLHSIFGWDIEAYFAYLFPLASFHSNWETLFSVEDKTGIVPYRDLHETLGFAYSVSVTPSYLHQAQKSNCRWTARLLLCSTKSSRFVRITTLSLSLLSFLTKKSTNTTPLCWIMRQRTTACF